MAKSEGTTTEAPKGFKIVNAVTLSGHLYGPAELAYTKEGKPWCRATLLHPHEGTESKSWVKIVAFGEVAEALGHGEDGQEIGVVGALRQNRWEAQDGTKRREIQIVCNWVKLGEITKLGKGVSGNGREPEIDPFA